MMPDRIGGVGANGARRSRTLVAGVLALLTLLAGCIGAGETLGVNVGGTSTVGVDRSQALASLNALRRQNGLPPVRYSETLEEAAERQARAMAARGDLDHSLDGRLPSRVAAFGYDWAAVAENIGWNYRSTSAVMAGWKGSSGHRKNMLNPNVTEVGMAAATGRDGEPYWAMILGRQKNRR